MVSTGFVTVLLIGTVSAVYNPIKYPPKPPVTPVVGYCNPNWTPVPCPAIPLRHECDNNQDCAGLLDKCCKDDCGNRICSARGIIPTKPPVIPVGYCNAIRRTIACPLILLRPECDSNQDCRGRFEICCKDDCGHRVCRARDIIPTKPPVNPIGYCNANWRPVPCPKIPLRHECDRNQDCRRPFETCCKDDCGNRICKRQTPTIPVRRCPNSKPVLCLHKRLPKHQCNTDLDCERNQFCCESSCGTRVCRSRSLAIPFCESRPSICPRFLQTSHQCHSDSDCRVGSKCCRDSCGTQVCQADRIVPSCPRLNIHTDIMCFKGRDLCYRNSDCRRGEICCKNGCNYNVCQRKTEKPGRCPVSIGGSRPLSVCRPRSNPRCRNDYDCRGIQKCCSDICGNSFCSDPVVL